MPILVLALIASAPMSYAIVVGENRGGDGQGTLRFAEDDAIRTAETLNEVAHFSLRDVHTAIAPSKRALLTLVAQVGEEVKRERAIGAQVTLLFYYSGHAHAAGLSLAGEVLDLTELRQALLASGATLTLVLLDACQSGAFSRIKGSGREADFSFNSTQRLNAEGLAVMASSSATELSQESELLRGSYFTHHFLSALRGAADTDQDGRVSLNEAYTYAYNQTLFDTARTAIGEQHVTLETDLRGKGDVPLSYPAEASASIAFPPELTGRMLITRQPQQTVIAEIYKAAGERMQLALVPGDYLVTVRAGTLYGCAVSLRSGDHMSLDVGKCAPLVQEGASSKHDLRPTRFTLEFGMGAVFPRLDRYRTRLEDFGFAHLPADPLVTVQGGVSYAILPQLAVFAAARLLDLASYQRDIGSAQTISDAIFSWNTWGVELGARGMWPLAHGHFVPFLQLGTGIAIATSSLDGIQQIYTGPLLDLGAGAIIVVAYHFAFVATGTFAFAPALRNDLGDKHDSGGAGLTLGMQVRL